MSADVTTEATQYLTFSLGEEDFTLEIARGMERLKYSKFSVT